MDEWGNPSFDDIRAGWRPKQPDPPTKGLSLEEAIARQQQEEAVANEPKRDAVEAGRRLLDDFVTLMKRNGRKPTLVFLEERHDAETTKKGNFLTGTRYVHRVLITYSLVGEGWGIGEESDARSPHTCYYVPGQGIVWALPGPAPHSGTHRGARSDHRHDYETRVPREMPPPGTEIAVAGGRGGLPEGDRDLAAYAGRAEDLARYARRVLRR
ncbi:hypothetical protein FK535_25020 [Mycolicibacterium sp. 018/SC-01/001]|uniref:hypothetical protein n=1 Tax=Mycolicibacterium sp. 018/SC-01/001 TaxID=2592069 RepID=UPI00117D252E|nr:hypothetical protein [Mycolicibacterium sp. 018/SC-01/001]TRW78490.1 hypothetical protein FK535_25020 [Mycolicibacterium sp. 018/SC-01/001]